MEKDWKPRVTIEVTEKQYYVLKEYLAHGMQKQVLGVMIDDLTNLLELYGYDVILAILSRRFSLVKQYKEKQEAEKVAV